VNILNNTVKNALNLEVAELRINIIALSAFISKIGQRKSTNMLLSSFIEEDKKMKKFMFLK
jgi:hypothetical protein